MIAKVITQDNREYYSVVFAQLFTGWETVLITYDSANARFDCADLYSRKPSLKRKCFILDNATNEWNTYSNLKVGTVQKLKHASGYTWLLENTELLNRILHEKEVEQEYLQIACEYNLSIEQSEWSYVKNESDVENLMSAAWGFHDGIIHSISFLHSPQAPSRIEIIFTECWESRITLIFEGDVVAHYTQEDTAMPDILEASVFFENGYVYWTNCDVSKFSDISDGSIYFSGRALKWKMETEARE